MSQAAYNNDAAFWPTKKELMTSLHKAGFKHVFEQFNFTGDFLPDNYNEFYQRGMFIAVK